MIHKRFYKSVAASSIEQDDYVPTNGQSLFLVKIGGNGAHECAIKIELIWDPDGTPEIIFATHGDGNQEFKKGKEIVGDGTKKLRIKLTNDSSNSETVGGYWEGEEY